MSTAADRDIQITPADLGRRLKAARLQRGEIQAAVAVRVGVDVVTYSRWERGLHRPRADYLPQLREALGLSNAEVGLPETRPQVARSVSAVVPLVASVGAEEDDDVRRREFLHGACGLLGAAAFLDWDGMASLLSAAAATDERAVHDLERITRGYASQWGAISPTTLLPLVQRHLLLLQSQLMTGPVTPALRPLLCSVSSETATVGGWLSVLVKNFGDARRYYTLARDLAREAGDGPQLALVLGGASSLFSRISSGDDSERARAMLQEAVQLAGPSACGHMRSWLHARLAEEHALAGESWVCHAELERASVALAAAPGGGDGIFSCCSSAWLDGFRGNCSLLLGSYSEASTILESTLASALALTSQRSAVMSDLGVAYARLGELESACDLLACAAELAAEARFAELVDRSCRARREHLRGYEDSLAVRLLDERLRVAVA